MQKIHPQLREKTFKKLPKRPKTAIFFKMAANVNDKLVKNIFAHF